ncbi:MAG: globin family protein [Betaproteobacteria bacterium]|nr:globin family protein [Betaproteobacteria bacterium]
MSATHDEEAAVEWMVRRFYELGLADDVLGPIFRDAIHDWDDHIRVVADFWSHSIHGTGRYQRNAFAPHMRLRFEPEAFDHWLAAFEQAARESLAPEHAEKAIRIARHMAQSYKAGMFPFADADGRPSRVPVSRNRGGG